MGDYNYSYSQQFSQMHPPNTDYANQGDGIREYYEMGNIKEKDTKSSNRPGRSDRRPKTRSRSQSTRSSSQSRSRSRSRSQSRSRTRSRSTSHQRNLSLKEPGFLDAFRVLYLTPSKHKKSTTKFLATKKRQDQIHEILKRDRLGSKRWFFYPRSQPTEENVAPVTRETSDQRFKVDANFFRKYKRSRKVDSEAPIMKLKRWELILYKKLGFIQAV